MNTNAYQNKPATGKQSEVITTREIKGTVFHSSYPPPEMMEQYAQVNPDFPNRLLSMAEKEGEHRRSMEGSIVKKAYFLDLLGMFFAFLAVGAILAVGIIFMYNDHAKEGAWIIGGVTVSIALAFITRGTKSSTAKK